MDSLSVDFYLFDGAKSTKTLYNFRGITKYRSLYMGRSEKDLAEIGPYLLQINCEIFYIELKNAWGESWGVLVQSDAPFDHIYTHFRKFLIVKTEDHQELYFRFYDPRVLRIFLPTCDDKQIREFFGPVQSFIMETENKDEAIRFWHQNGILQQEIFPAEKLFTKTAALSE